jgi:hypothetical protein
MYIFNFILSSPYVHSPTISIFILRHRVVFKVVQLSTPLYLYVPVGLGSWLPLSATPYRIG